MNHESVNDALVYVPWDVDILALVITGWMVSVNSFKSDTAKRHANKVLQADLGVQILRSQAI